MNINNFGPFHSDIWGNVSDIIIVLITFIGTIYIVKSFMNQKRLNKNQLKINQQQTEINRLLMEKDRREIRPYFKINQLSKNFEYTYLDLKLDNAIAFMIKFSYDSKDTYEISQNILYQNEWEVGGMMRIKMLEKDFKGKKSISVSLIEIIFKDEAGRAYKQQLIASSDFKITVPTLIEDYGIWKLNSEV